MDIFTINDSHRCKFHLELDTNKYREYSRKIVENGGEVVSVPDDNVFTFTTRNIFTKTGIKTTSIGIKDKYNIKYVDECINKGKLLDIGEYELSNRKNYGCAHSLLYFGEKHCPVAKLLQKKYTASLSSKCHQTQISKTNSAGTGIIQKCTEPLGNTQKIQISSDISTQTMPLENLKKKKNQEDENPNEDLDFEDVVENENKKEDKRKNPFYFNKTKSKIKESASRTEENKYQLILNIDNLIKDVRPAREEKERREELIKNESKKSEREISENLQRIVQTRMEKEELLNRMKKLERIQQEIRKEKEVCSQEKKRMKEEVEKLERKLKSMEKMKKNQLKRIEELKRTEQEHRKKEEEWIQQKKQIRQKLIELEIDLKIKKREVKSQVYSIISDCSETRNVQQNNVNNICKYSKSGDPTLESKSREKNCSGEITKSAKSTVINKTTLGKRGLSDLDIGNNLSGIKRPKIENKIGDQMEREDFTTLENMPSHLQKISLSTQIPSSQASEKEIFYNSHEELLFESDEEFINAGQPINEKQLDNPEKDSEISHESHLPSIVTPLSMDDEERRENVRVRTGEEEESPVLDDISKAFLQDDSETDFDSMLESHSPRFNNFDPDVQIIKQEKNLDTNTDENIKVKIESPVGIDETLNNCIDDESVSDAETIRWSNREVLLNRIAKNKI